MPQINPSIAPDLDARLEELAGIYDGAKTFVAKVALEYGIRHFKLAWAEYSAVRHASYRDSDDGKSSEAKVVKLAPGA